MNKFMLLVAALSGFCLVVSASLLLVAISEGFRSQPSFWLAVSGTTGLVLLILAFGLARRKRGKTVQKWAARPSPVRKYVDSKDVR